MERRILLRPIKKSISKKKKPPLERLLRKQFPIHHKKFMFIHSKRNDTPVHGFPYTDDGFAKFIDVLGPVPKTLKTPSLGRRDHTKGYSEDNLVWQEWLHNQAEAHFRVRWLLPLGFKTWDELLAHLRKTSY